MITSTVEPAQVLTGQLREYLGGDPDWTTALDQLARSRTGLHLAVLTEPFLGWLLDGTKTIESRFSRVRCAPYGVVDEGDIVVVKKPGAPVTGVFQAGRSSSYQLTPAKVAELRDRYAAQICARDDDFWQQRADCAYATLIQVMHVRMLPALPFPKKDRRGWVQLARTRTQLTLL
jgi:hypothetical protein